MQFRCYTCSFKFHEGMQGLPPMDAFSTEQAPIAAVEGESPNRFSALEGTPFEGMSTGSFCSFCLVVIQNFAVLFEFPRVGRRKDFVALAEIEFPNDGGNRINCYASRLSIVATARSMFDSDDYRQAFDLIDSLIKEGLED